MDILARIFYNYWAMNRLLDLFHLFVDFFLVIVLGLACFVLIVSFVEKLWK